MRNTTERPEALAAGTIKLVGTSKNKIVQLVDQLLTDKDEYQKMSMAHNPYGNGFASEAICKVLEEVEL
jgi:UDP-N-acetylglucosamine 2-epimerase (non-hydrolysing)